LGSFKNAYFAHRTLFTITGTQVIDPEARVNDSENNINFTSALSPGIEEKEYVFSNEIFTWL